MNPYPYISLVVHLPPDLAKLAFDGVASECAGDRPRGWEIVVPTGLLRLDGPAVVGFLAGGYAPYRKVNGVVRRGWSGLGRGVPVELELLPWSESRTELGLTALGSMGPWRLPDRFYLDVGGTALEALRAAMQAWPDGLVGGMAGDWEEELALGGR